jgi:hypothetical protein
MSKSKFKPKTRKEELREKIDTMQGANKTKHSHYASIPTIILREKRDNVIFMKHE